MAPGELGARLARMRLKVELCRACAAVLRAELAARGPEAMARKAATVLRGCAVCSLQLPAEARAARRFETRLKLEH